MHEVVDELRGDHTGAQLVPDEPGSSHQIGFGVQPPPGGDQQVEPHIVWVVGEAVAQNL